MAVVAAPVKLATTQQQLARHLGWFEMISQTCLLQMHVLPSLPFPSFKAVVVMNSWQLDVRYQQTQVVMVTAIS